MKLSQMTTGQALDALCRLAPQIANIIEDKAILDAVSSLMPDKKGGEAEKKDETGAGFKFMAGLGKVVPLLLKDHQADVYCILSVLNGKEPEEIAAQNLMETMAQVRETFTDREFMAFFKASVAQAVSG